MRRIFYGTLSLLVLAIFSLVGCESKQTASPAASEATDTTATSSSASSETTAEATTETSSEPAAIASDSDDAALDAMNSENLPELNEESKSLLGTLQDGVYTNETVGFSITMPVGWSALAPTEIQEMSGNPGLESGGMVVSYAFPGEIANLGNGDINSFMITVEQKHETDDLRSAFLIQQTGYENMKTQLVASQSAGEAVPSITLNEFTEWEKNGHQFYQLATKMEMDVDGQQESQLVITLVAESNDYVVAIIQSAGDTQNEALLKAAADSLTFTK